MNHNQNRRRHTAFREAVGAIILALLFYTIAVLAFAAY